MKAVSRQWHNPSALYKEGVIARQSLDAARKEVARSVHATPQEIYFTASGTEADNIAIRGVVLAAKKTIVRPHIITSCIEHPAVLELCKALIHEGCDVDFVPVRPCGRVDIEILKKLLRAETVIVSIMHVNNEIGVIQPLRDIRAAITSFKKNMGNEHSLYPVFHSDESQSPCFLDINREKLAVDAMTLDGSKIYGPKGIGMLYLKRNIPCSPLIIGGGHESGLRAGTENVAAIVGFASALSYAQSEYKELQKKVTVLRDYFFSSLERMAHDENFSLTINGHREHRIANNVNVCVRSLNAEFAVLQLDARGISCASMTSCKTLGDDNASYVVEALGVPGCSQSSLRFTLGKSTRRKDIDVTISHLRDIIRKQYGTI